MHQHVFISNIFSNLTCKLLNTAECELQNNSESGEFNEHQQRGKKQPKSNFSPQVAQREKHILKFYYKMNSIFCSLKHSFCFSTKEKKKPTNNPNLKHSVIAISTVFVGLCSWFGVLFPVMDKRD